MITKTKIFQGKDYKKPGNPNRLNDYHVISYVFKIPVSSMWVQGLDDWAKENSFRGMTIIKWDGTEQEIKDDVK